MPFEAGQVVASIEIAGSARIGSGALPGSASARSRLLQRQWFRWFG